MNNPLYYQDIPVEIINENHDGTVHVRALEGKPFRVEARVGGYWNIIDSAHLLYVKRDELSIPVVMEKESVPA